MARAVREGTLSGALPAVILHTIDSRLAHLSEPARELADLAAAIGRQFTYSILAHACHCDEDSLVPALDELWQRRIIREQGNDAYDFAHDKIREVAYSSLSAARRRLLHRRIAVALEEVHGHEPDAVAPAVALHYDRAGDAARAVLHLMRAAQAAGAVYANEEAISYLQRALELAPEARVPDLEVAALHEALGRILARAGRHAEARTHNQDALDLLPASQRLRRAQLNVSLAETWHAQHRYADAHAALAAALAALGEEPADSDEEWWKAWTRMQFVRGDLLYFQARLDELADLNRQMEAVLARRGTIEQQAQLYARVRQQRLRQERYRPSPTTIEITRKSVELARQANNRELAGYEIFALGFLLLWCDDLDGAAEWLNRALHEALSMGHVPLEDRCRAYLTITARLCGDVEGVHSQVEAAMRVATAEQSPFYTAVAHGNL
ncbi:MAG TPA: tetratricopeptide repeat protein, partial [Anaerolineae bacterium]|nr:tetratricopeptide repeat protein [Anaerolineae bacterium]